MRGFLTFCAGVVTGAVGLRLFWHTVYLTVIALLAIRILSS